MVRSLLIAIALFLAIFFAGLFIASFAAPDINGSRLVNSPYVTTLPVVLETDTTDVVDLRAGGANEITYFWTLSAMTDTVWVTVQGSQDGIRWANLDIDGPAVYALADSGTYGYRSLSPKSVPLTRVILRTAKTIVALVSFRIGGGI